MTPELVITAIATFLAGLLSKIVYDWLKGGRRKNPGNHNNHKNPNTSVIVAEVGSVYDLLEKAITELSAIKEATIWLRDIHNNMDPVTGQPRWYVTPLVAEIKGMREDLDDSLKLERKNRDLLLSLVPRTRDGTDPSIGGGT